MSETVRETSTGYLVSTLTRGDACHVLTWQPGADRPPRRAPSDADVDGVAQLIGPSMVAVPGRWRDGAWHYRVPGPASLAVLLSAGMHREPLLDLCGALGAALAQVHTGVEPAVLDEPAGASRLHGWLRGEAGERASERAGRLVAEELGSGGVRDLLDDLDELRHDPATTLLGAPGSATVYPDPAGGPATLLVTDELARGTAAWDLGWFAGEMLERSLAAPAASDVLAAATGRLLTAHARLAGTTDVPRLATAMIARVLVHVHDYASYVGWHDSLVERVRAVGRWRSTAELTERWCITDLTASDEKRGNT